MVVCPQCGYPQEDSEVVVDADVSCTFCKWSGTRKDLLRIMSNDLGNHPQIVKRLQVFMEYLHRRVAADVARKIVKLGLVPADAEFTPLLASALQKGTRALYQSIVEELFTEDQDGDEPEAGGCVRP